MSIGIGIAIGVGGRAGGGRKSARNARTHLTPGARSGGRGA